MYSIVQASFFIHINQTCFSLDSCTVKFNPDPLHHVILNEEERKMSYYLGRYYVDIRSPCKYQKNIFICCLVNMPHCMLSKTKGLIGVRLFSISSSYIDHSGTEAENGRKQTVNAWITSKRSHNRSNPVNTLSTALCCVFSLPFHTLLPPSCTCSTPAHIMLCSLIFNDDSEHAHIYPAIQVCF